MSVSLVRTRMRLRQIFQHRRAWHVLVGAPLLACVLLVTGCTTGFVYNRLDTLAGWYFESLVSLNDDQRSELRAWLERTLAWHRQSELTRYVEFVNDVSATVAQPRPRETYDAMRIRFQGLIDGLIAKTAPEASQLLLRLSPQQVDELLANLEEKTRESTKENAEAVAENEWRPKQTKSFIKQMKRWTGSVTPQQKDMIAARIAQLEPTHEDWAESQRAWREALRQALARQRTASEDDAVAAPQLLGGEPACCAGQKGQSTQEQLIELLADPDRQWTAAYSQKVARNRDRYQQLIMDLDASLSRQQRDHLRAELDELADSLARLARG